jgi:hypothetical protein
MNKKAFLFKIFLKLFILNLKSDIYIINILLYYDVYNRY